MIVNSQTEHMPLQPLYTQGLGTDRNDIVLLTADTWELLKMPYARASLGKLSFTKCDL